MAKSVNTGRKRGSTSRTAVGVGDEQQLLADRPRDEGQQRADAPRNDAQRGDSQRDEGSRGNRVPVEQIRSRAYELYLARGNQPGDEVGDWLRAEREYSERSHGERSNGERSNGDRSNGERSNGDQQAGREQARQ